ncbi:MAG: four helix bundle protein [Opitutus sp.]|nr:four helix bundle protein [Opitutus sp.]
MFNFEKLEVWQKAIAYAGQVYRVTKVLFGLTNQVRRAANSISSNIAEGSARPPVDYARFLSYAAGSLFEVVTQATIARNEGFLTPDVDEKLYAEAEEISRMRSGLRRSRGE